MYKLQHKFEWMGHFQVDIHILMMICWTLEKSNSLHPQELENKPIKWCLDHLRKLVRNCSCIWDHVVGLHMVTWNALCVRNFMLMHHVVREQVTKVGRNRPYATVREIMINMTRLVFQQSDSLWISSTSTLKRHFLYGHKPNFGRSIKNLGPFLSWARVDVH